MDNNRVCVSSFTVRNSTPSRVMVEIFLGEQIMNQVELEVNEISDEISMRGNFDRLCFCVTDIETGARRGVKCPEDFICSKVHGVKVNPITLGIYRGSYVMISRK